MAGLLPFWLVPMQQAAMQHSTREERSSRPAQKPAKAGRRVPKVVLADDSIFHRMMMRTLLETDGYHVLEAGDGREALELVRLERPDVVVMDIAMPSMDGVTTARRIRGSTGSIAGVPIVFVTALAASSDRETALAAGGNAYLVKPIANRELLAAVRRYANRGDGTQS
jgi:CheY-like chemotaxis protein